MESEIVCYRCGSDLEALTLPFSREDICPSCSAWLHVCRMCRHYDRDVARQCREDDAEEVLVKDRPNVCDWFAPAAGAWDAGGAGRDARARAELASLFGDESDGEAQPDDAQSAAEKLFGK